MPCSPGGTHSEILTVPCSLTSDLDLQVDAGVTPSVSALNSGAGAPTLPIGFTALVSSVYRGQPCCQWTVLDTPAVGCTLATSATQCVAGYSNATSVNTMWEGRYVRFLTHGCGRPAVLPAHPRGVEVPAPPSAPSFQRHDATPTTPPPPRSSSSSAAFSPSAVAGVTIVCVAVLVFALATCGYYKRAARGASANPAMEQPRRGGVSAWTQLSDLRSANVEPGASRG